jgi:hypothetical protein
MKVCPRKHRTFFECVWILNFSNARRTITVHSRKTEALKIRKRRHFATGLPQRLSRLSGTAVEPIRSFVFDHPLAA